MINHYVRRACLGFGIGLMLCVAMHSAVASARVGESDSQRASSVAEQRVAVSVVQSKLIDGVSGEAGWQPRFYGPGVMGRVVASVVWDDGDGPALYVGGQFLTAGKQVVNSVAKWSGSEWLPLTGSFGTGVVDPSGDAGLVRALTVHDGNLVVAGGFQLAGGVTAQGMARWDGSEWSAFVSSTGIGPGAVNAMVSFQGSLHVAGEFVVIGETTFNRIARWSEATSSWMPLTGSQGTGVALAGSFTCANSSVSYAGVHALSVYEDRLIVGGCFQFAGGEAISSIAAWDGQEWAGLGTGIAGVNPLVVHSLAIHDGELMAGGRFGSAGGIPAANIASWDGDAWSGVGTGVSGAVLTLLSSGSSLYAGGLFSTAGEVSANRVARWDGEQWSALASGGEDGVGVDGPASAGVITLSEFKGAIHVGGIFDRAGGRVANNLASWQLGEWHALAEAGGSSGLVRSTASPGTVETAVEFEGALVAGGRFRSAGNVVANSVARWDGAQWNALGPQETPGMTRADPSDPGTVYAVAVHQGSLFAAGDFQLAGGIAANRIARWTGTAWQALQNGVDGTVWALASVGDDLYVAGDFVTASGLTVNRIARWDGDAWHPLSSAGGVGLSARAVALLPTPDGLVVGGAFTSAGGVNVGRIARWNGVEWQAIGNLPGPVNADGIVMLDGVLHVAHRTSTGGYSKQRISRWNDPIWVAVPGLSEPPGLVGGVYRIGLHEGVIVAAMAYTDAVNEPGFLNGIGRWDGVGWSPVGGGGIDGSATLMKSIGGQLLVGTDSGEVVGGVPAWGLVQWTSEPTVAQFPALPSAHAGTSVVLEVDVSGESTPPLPGRVTIRSDSGESCESSAGKVVSPTSVRYACSLTFASAGQRLLSVFFNRAPQHRTARILDVPLPVLPPPSADASLAALQTNVGSLVPAFASSTFDYSVGVESQVESIEVTPFASHPGATLTVNGVETASGESSEPIALETGLSAVRIQVTAENQLAQRAYVLRIVRPPAEGSDPGASQLLLSVEGSSEPAPHQAQSGGPRVYRIIATNLGADPLGSVRLGARVVSGLSDLLWDCNVPLAACQPAHGMGSAFDTDVELGPSLSAIVEMSGVAEPDDIWVVVPITAEASGGGHISKDRLLLIDATSSDAVNRSGFEPEVTPD